MSAVAAATNALRGERLRLAAIDLDKDLAPTAAWSQDSELLRMLQSQVARHWTVPELRQWLDEEQGSDQPNPNAYFFSVRALADDRLLGSVDISIHNWAHRDAFVAIFIGDQADRNQGYGSEAMRLLLRFAFMELNLFRVTLSVFAYNPRAIRTYEKLGFVPEGRQRERLRRDGQYSDLLFMGLLRSEWLAGARSAETA